MKWDPKSVRRAREREGWSLADLARALGVNEKTVLRWERGRHKPQHRYVVQIHRLLERDLGERAGARRGN